MSTSAVEISGNFRCQRVTLTLNILIQEKYVYYKIKISKKLSVGVIEVENVPQRLTKSPNWNELRKTFGIHVHLISRKKNHRSFCIEHHRLELQIRVEELREAIKR